jgi:hypothetical protein
MILLTMDVFILQKMRVFLTTKGALIQDLYWFLFIQCFPLEACVSVSELTSSELKLMVLVYSAGPSENELKSVTSRYLLGTRAWK